MKDEMGILKEVSSISAAHGSIALSEILGKRIKLSLPALDIVPREVALEKIELDQIVISVSSHILTGLKGNIIFVLDENSAFKLVDMCYRAHKDDKKEGSLTAMGMSIIKEVGNVVISSFIGAISIMLKTVIIPSIPTLTSGPIQQIIDMAILSYDGNDYIMLAEAIFEETEEHIRGSFYLVLNSEAMKHIQTTCKKLLETISQEEE
ncbi:MAG: chemotaxis protein CheC [Candidatus Omnitrophota bacterium]|nr:chemotaxis protein CheC [Candidatus Omnitrophota bacterium]MBU1871404.1 chemotaxis protein CheC [Candidatus Omnitrophota bacterium]